jgi:hypothetical protein
MRTGLLKPISKRTTQTIVFIRASITIATKIASAATVTITPMNSAHLQDGKFGGGGNLFTPETPACRAGSCAYQKRSFGGTADYGATTPSPCWLLFFAFISRLQPEAWWLLHRRVSLRELRTCNNCIKTNCADRQISDRMYQRSKPLSNRAKRSHPGRGECRRQ